MILCFRVYFLFFLIILKNEKDDKKPIETKPPDQNMVQSNTDDLNKSKTDNENLKQDSAKVIAENFQNKNNKKAKKVEIN